jgi:hypothetical protein
MEANPFIVEMQFPEPRALGGVAADLSAMDLDWSVTLTPPDGPPVEYSLAQTNPTGEDVHAEIAFDRGPDLVSAMRMSIKNPQLTDFANIHVRDIYLR